MDLSLRYGETSTSWRLLASGCGRAGNAECITKGSRCIGVVLIKIEMNVGSAWIGKSPQITANHCKSTANHSKSLQINLINQVKKAKPRSRAYTVTKFVAKSFQNNCRTLVCVDQPTQFCVYHFMSQTVFLCCRLLLLLSLLLAVFAVPMQ